MMPAVTNIAREGSPVPGSRLTSGEIVTQIQSGSPRPDSPVRILYAQPNLIFGQIALSIACRLRRDGGGFCQQIKWLA